MGIRDTDAASRTAIMNAPMKIVLVMLVAMLLGPGIQAASSVYEFRGTILSSSSNNPIYPVGSLDATLGSTPVTYLFEVDFNRNVSTFQNSAGTWNYFYADFFGRGVMATEMGTIPAENDIGFDVNYVSSSDTGQLGGGGVRVFYSSLMAQAWRVEGWKVGDRFRFTDGTIPPGGGVAVYYLGEVTLTSITPIPEPSGSVLATVGITALLSIRFRRSKTKLMLSR